MKLNPYKIKINNVSNFELLNDMNELIVELFLTCGEIELYLLRIKLGFD